MTLAPTNTRPRPSVWARSLNTEPGERDVGTGTPPSKRNVEPPLVALTGRFATFWLIAALSGERGCTVKAFTFDGNGFSPLTLSDALQAA